MKKRNVLIVSVSVLLIVVIGLIFFHGRSDSTIESRALNVVDSLQAGKYQEAVKDFRDNLRAMGSSEVLGQQWAKAVAMFGPLRKRTVIGTHVTNNASGSSTIPGACKTVELCIEFEKGTLYGHIPFDSNNQIIDLKIDGHHYDPGSN